MPRVSYVNGVYVPHRDATVHVEDRGYQFADSVYEVVPVAAGKIRHLEQHLDRLGRSLDAIGLAWPVARAALRLILAEVVRRNRVVDGIVYIQVSRGVAHRNHLFPSGAKPSLVVSAWASKGPSAQLVAQGVAVVTLADQRWKRPDIKTVGLLANVLGRQSAKEAGVYEAWLVDETGYVTEGTATNAFIVTADGSVVTRQADCSILGGVTRANVLDLARRAGMTVAERPFTVAEAQAAREAFITGSTFMVLPVVRIDGTDVGDGKPGPVTLRLRALYRESRMA